MRIRFTALLALLCLFFVCFALADDAPITIDMPELKPPDTSVEWKAIPIGEAAPYAPQDQYMDEDRMGYYDGSISIRSEVIRVYETNITVVWVDIVDPSQIRTALAAKKYPSKRTETTGKLAETNNAVLAISGDYFSYHSQGIAVRGGKILRNSPHAGRDTLAIDWDGNFSILHPTTKEAFAEIQENTREAFCFGPYLVKDGVKLSSYDDVNISLDAKHRHIRLGIGQTGPLSYVIFCSEGPEHGRSLGLTILQEAEVAYALGCINAYNLDGGSSATVILNGELLYQPGTTNKKQRAVGDIIYFASLVPEGYVVEDEEAAQ